MGQRAPVITPEPPPQRPVESEITYGERPSLEVQAQIISNIASTIAEKRGNQAAQDYLESTRPIFERQVQERQQQAQQQYKQQETAYQQKVNQYLQQKVALTQLDRFKTPTGYDLVTASRYLSTDTLRLAGFNDDQIKRAREMTTDTTQRVSIDTFKRRYYAEQGWEPFDNRKYQSSAQLEAALARDNLRAAEAQRAFREKYGTGALLQSVGINAAARMPVFGLGSLQALQPDVTWKDIPGWQYGLDAAKVLSLTAPLWVPQLNKFVQFSNLTKLPSGDYVLSEVTGSMWRAPSGQLYIPPPEWAKALQQSVPVWQAGRTAPRLYGETGLPATRIGESPYSVGGQSGYAAYKPYGASYGIQAPYPGISGASPYFVGASPQEGFLPGGGTGLYTTRTIAPTVSGGIRSPEFTSTRPLPFLTATASYTSYPPVRVFQPVQPLAPQPAPPKKPVIEDVPFPQPFTTPGVTPSDTPAPGESTAPGVSPGPGPSPAPAPSPAPEPAPAPSPSPSPAPQPQPQPQPSPAPAPSPMPAPSPTPGPLPPKYRRMMVPPPKLTKEQREAAMFLGAIAWRQGQLKSGEVSKILKPPYRQRDLTTKVGQMPAGVTSIRGPGSAKQTVTLLSGQAPGKPSRADVGAFIVTVIPQSKKRVTIDFVRDPSNRRPQKKPVKNIPPRWGKPRVRELGGGVVETTYRGKRRRHLKLY